MSSLPDSSLSDSSPRRLAAIILVATAALPPPLAHAQTVPVQMHSEAVALMQLCRNDYHRLCAGVVPGGGRVLACLQSHANELSPGCGQSMSRAQTLKDSATTAGVLPK